MSVWRAFGAELGEERPTAAGVRGERAGEEAGMGSC